MLSTLRIGLLNLSLVLVPCAGFAQVLSYPVPGKTLAVRQKQTGEQRLKLKVKSGNVRADVPCGVDGELIVRTDGAMGAEQRFPLEAALWEPISASNPSKGCRYRGGPVVSKLQLKIGRSLKIVAAADDLGVPLTTDPRPVWIELIHGDVRHCLEFGGDAKHKADSRLIARNALDIAMCPTAKPAHEVLQPKNGDFITWLTPDPTIEQYEALSFPVGWLRNQPREGVGAVGRFRRSPGATADGEFTRNWIENMPWVHVATVVEFLGALDPAGLLTAVLVDKHHELTWFGGNDITVITDPGGERYALVSRDANRTFETPTMPAGWTHEIITLSEDVLILLPQPTTVIRSDNQDSFQGPVPAEIVF
jgi:hypothetical protein